MKWLYAPRPIDYAMRAVRTAHLVANARAFVAYDKLEQHYWHCGALYREDRELAAASGLSVSSFRGVKGLLIRLFDVDETGLWRDYDLEQDRDEAIRETGGDPADYRARPAATGPAPASADPQDPGQKPNRSVINARNAHARWDRKRGLQKAAAASAEAAEDVAGMRNDMRIASVPMQNTMQNGDANGAKSNADSHRFASSHSASSLDDEDDDSDKSSSSSSNPPVPAAHANAKPDANLHSVASHAGPGRTGPIVKEFELLDILLVATGGNVEPRLKHVSSVKPYRDLMREGCDLELHILPELQAVRTLNQPLKHPCPDWLRDQIRARRDAPVQPPRPAVRQNPAQKVFVEKGTPGDLAWRAYRKRMDGRSFTQSTKRGSREGWYFAAEFPPELPAETMAAAG